MKKVSYKDLFNSLVGFLKDEEELKNLIGLIEDNIHDHQRDLEFVEDLTSKDRKDYEYSIHVMNEVINHLKENIQ